MAILHELRETLEVIESRIGAVEDDALLEAMRALDGDAMVALLRQFTAMVNGAERLLAVGAGIVAERSRRDHGYDGLAASQGHRSPESLVQSISGRTRAEAARAVRLGESLLVESAVSPGGSDESDAAPVEVLAPWHDPLRQAMFAGSLTPAQHDAILRGLGEPPEREGESAEVVREVWSTAARQLILEARDTSVEELVRRARQVRNTLDADELERTFQKRYEARSIKLWTTADGTRGARITFDDEMAAWVDSLLDAALRPRRGGPRFVDSSERAAADDLVNDPRTNDQLAYDVFTDVLRAGSLAKAPDVFGARQPGVRMVVVKDASGPLDPFGRMLPTGHLEDRGDALPGGVIDRTVCANGTREVTVDRFGNPLNVGREHRLFTAKQRIALAVRDGGCMFIGCRTPASYCEAHHCDHWHEDLGSTDIDRGILLCRHHHMLLHNNRWKITRDGQGPFLLHPPDAGAEPIPLRTRSPLAWAWDPPPLDRPGWRDAGAVPVLVAAG